MIDQAALAFSNSLVAGSPVEIGGVTIKKEGQAGGEGDGVGSPYLCTCSYTDDRCREIRSYIHRLSILPVTFDPFGGVDRLSDFSYPSGHFSSLFLIAFVGRARHDWLGSAARKRKHQSTGFGDAGSNGFYFSATFVCQPV